MTTGLTATLVASSMLATACGGAESIEIELDEVNGSGISGEVELSPVGDRATRITVVEVRGGEITGARIMPGRCKAHGALDDKYPITPPSGTVQLDFDELREWSRDPAGCRGVSAQGAVRRVRRVLSVRLSGPRAAGSPRPRR